MFSFRVNLTLTIQFADRKAALKPDEVAPDMRRELVARRRAADRGIIIPRAAAQHASLPARRPLRLLHWAAGIILFVKPIRAPFPDVAEHVIRPPRIRQEFPHRMRLTSGVAVEPCVLGLLAQDRCQTAKSSMFRRGRRIPIPPPSAAGSPPTVPPDSGGIEGRWRSMLR